MRGIPFWTTKCPGITANVYPRAAVSVHCPRDFSSYSLSFLADVLLSGMTAMAVDLPGVISDLLIDPLGRREGEGGHEMPPTDVAPVLRRGCSWGG